MVTFQDVVVFVFPVSNDIDPGRVRRRRRQFRVGLCASGFVCSARPALFTFHHGAAVIRRAAVCMYCTGPWHGPGIYDPKVHNDTLFTYAKNLVVIYF